MKIENVILDVGGVLLSYRWLGVIMETIPEMKEAKAFAKRLYGDPLWLDFDIGLRSFDAVVEDYVRKYPKDEEHIRYVLGHLERMPIARQKVWEKVHAVKEAGYHIYLLSNYSSRMFQVHTDGLPFLDDLDGRIISFEVHSLKPNREIYEALFEKYSLNPNECIFFDDRQENVDAGRKCGMEGRVIYTEDTIAGYLDRLLAPDYISNPFHDTAKSEDERINWLLSHMNMEEKINMYSHPEQGAGRFGVEGFVLGGEASHGVEARNDQNGIGEIDITTTFPNPIGMSASWDRDLIREAGRITGTEARACFRRHRKTGLSRWAPTIDLERDPRWGRNEEGYGEDPYLVSEMAGAYIKGMKGEDPYYIRCGATLKHFYANNVEKDRFFTNSSIGLRDKKEYYLKPFQKAIENAGAIGVMAAYNKINGIPGMTDPEVNALLKDKYRLLHTITDGFAMVRLMDYHHEYGTLAECLAASVKVGIDCMNDKPEAVEKALRDALEWSLISEKELDTALKNILMTGMRLGIYDTEGLCPYDKINADEIDTEEARSICRKMSLESIVLLENRNDTLPLKKEDCEKILIAGPLAKEWYRDWYAGISPFEHSVYDGISSLMGMPMNSVLGLDKYKIYIGNKAWHIEEDGYIGLSDQDQGDLFYIENWGEGYHTIRSVSSGKYVQSCFYGEAEENRGLLIANKDNIFDWFTTCRFFIKDEIEDDNVVILDRFAKPVSVTQDNRLKADDKLNFSRIRIEKVSDGIRETVDAAVAYDTVILVLGCNPLVPAREDYDRTTLALPDTQQRLLDAFADSEKKVIAVLLSNYPYTMNGAEKKVDALLLSPTGSEYMGDAVASVIFGEVSPCGKLVQGWPVSEKVLPDIRDYRIIGKRTYRFVTKDWLYPFGYGLTYGKTVYSNFKIKEDPSKRSIETSLTVENKGKWITDEIIQIYAKGSFSDERFMDNGYGRRLIGFKRIKGLQPGENRKADLIINKEDLNVYDVVKGEYIIYSGVYHIYAGHHAFDEAVSADVFVEGECFTERDLSKLTPVYACDSYENTEFIKGHFHMTAAAVNKQFLQLGKEADLIFAKCRIPKKTIRARVLLRSENSGKVEIIWNAKTIGIWSGNTSSYDRALTVYELPTENSDVEDHWTAKWEEKECTISSSGIDDTGTLKLKISGDVQVLSIKFLS